MHTTDAHQTHGESSQTAHESTETTAPASDGRAGQPMLTYRPRNQQNPDSQGPTITSVEDGGDVQQRRDSTGRTSLREATGTARYKKSETSTSTGLQDESADDMLLRLSNEFQAIVEPSWDTVVYIGPPPQEHQQDDHEYSHIKQHFSKPYLINSQTLKDANSTQFNKFLGPMSARAERRLKKLGVHQRIPQDRRPKYFIDLRPMQDEDEALLMITELTCSPGVLSWHTSHLVGGVPKTLICGKDDLNITSKPHSRSWIEVDDAVMDDDENEEETKVDVDSSDIGVNILDLEPEYSALRHYTAIERLLHALVGNDPKLNSAPKVWTYFAIAKFFDCAMNAKVTTWIYNWLFMGNNNNFVQANPEVSYRMALGMRSPDILRTTFAMLVGERALFQAGRHAPDSPDLRSNAVQYSTHGRNLCHLDDDEINRIDHAAHSLTRRVEAIFNSLANAQLNWTSGRSELGKLQFAREYYKDSDVVEEPYKILCEYVRGEIYQALSQNVQEGDLMRLYRTKGYGEFGWLKRSRSFADLYNFMPLPQRLLTQSFWSQLENYGLYQEIEKSIMWSRGHSLRGLSDLAPDQQGAIDCVSKHALLSAIENMNESMTVGQNWLAVTKAAWSRVTERGTTHDAAFLPNGKVATADQEVVRAMQGVYHADATALPGHRFRPYDNGQFAENYPYNIIANGERVNGAFGTVKLALLLAELTLALRTRIMREILTPGYVDDEIAIETEISISQMDILLCLNDDEWKYLPLWAGGLDDGSGGVFAELDVPDMEGVEGFRGGKMGLHGLPGSEGSVGSSFSMAGDSEDFDEVMTEEGVSTVGRASRNATDGTTSAGASTVMSLDE